MFDHFGWIKMDVRVLYELELLLMFPLVLIIPRKWNIWYRCLYGLLILFIYLHFCKLQACVLCVNFTIVYTTLKVIDFFNLKICFYRNSKIALMALLRNRKVIFFDIFFRFLLELALVKREFFIIIWEYT